MKYNDTLVRSIAMHLKEATRDYTDKEMENLLIISQYDRDRAKLSAEESMNIATQNLHKSYSRSLLVFAGMCVAPFSAGLTGSVLPSGVGLGLGLGVLGCVAYSAYNSFKYMQTEKMTSEKIEESEATVTATEYLIEERRSL